MPFLLASNQLAFETHEVDKCELTFNLKVNHLYTYIVYLRAINTQNQIKKDLI